MKKPNKPRWKKWKANGAASPSGQTGAADSEPLVLQQDAGRGETTGDARMVSRFVRERWPCDPERRIALREKVQTRALETDSDRTLGILARVDAQMEGQNQKDDLAAVEPNAGVDETVVNDLRQTLEEMRADPVAREAYYNRIAVPYR